jgi:hypothetical protein
MEKIGQKAMRADNGDVLRVTKMGVAMTETPTRDNPPLVGLKTLQGANWSDRHYLMVTTPKEKTEPAPAQLPANANGRQKPRIFDITPK